MSPVPCFGCGALIDVSLPRCPHCHARVRVSAAELEGSRDSGCGTIGLALIGALGLVGSMAVQGIPDVPTWVRLVGLVLIGVCIFTGFASSATGSSPALKVLSRVGTVMLVLLLVCAVLCAIGMLIFLSCVLVITQGMK